MTCPAPVPPSPRKARRTLIGALISACLAAVVAVPGSVAAAAAVPPHDAHLQETADAVVAARGGRLFRPGRRRPAAVQAVSGRADRGTGRRLRGDDQFEIGSNTKTMIATIALQLVAEGRLRLDDPVRTLLPGVVPAAVGGEVITLRMLLQHTSGLYSYTDRAFMTALVAHPRAVYSPERLIAAALAHPSTVQLPE